MVPEFLSGADVWAQGFSEPEAGSDLASLRTRAEVDGDDLVVNGAKIWTTWAKYADWCLALVRTGTAEQRHRGLTAVAIDLRSPGVRVSPIKQGNGIEELAEVSFTDVRVPVSQIVGEIGGGWRVAMYLLARERGVTSWLRHCSFRERLAACSATAPAAFDRQLGDLVLQTAGIRAVAATLLTQAAPGKNSDPSPPTPSCCGPAPSRRCSTCCATSTVSRSRCRAPIRTTNCSTRTTCSPASSPSTAARSRCS